MATHPTLKAEKREILGKKVGRLRRQGIVPATVYGPAITPTSIQINAHEFSSVLRHAGRTGLIDLLIEDEAPRPVFIRTTQVEHKRNTIQHVEFLQPNLNRPITARVPVHMTGEAPAAREGAIILQALDHIDIESLPEQVPAEGLHVDVSCLTDTTGTLHVSDITALPGVTILTPADEVVITATAPPTEAEVEEVVEEVMPTQEEEQEEASSVPEA
ncbi:MAG TPA: 50S ribosomal protein L25 [Chloroflexota bacterium]|nr:50S ribosomal protein L25 [Chloroflexota bacterium]